MSNDKIPLYEGGEKEGGGGGKYGTIGEMEMEEEEDLPPNQPSRTKLAMGVGFSLISAVSLSLAVIAIINLGRESVPTVQIIVLAYAVQAVMLIPVIIIFFKAFMADTQEHFSSILFTGLLLSLGVICSYQAAIILPGKVLVSLTPAAILVITLFYTWCTDGDPGWVFAGICTTSLTGLVLMASHGIKESYTSGWVPVINARDVGLTGRSGTESDSGASIKAETTNVAPGDAPVGTDDDAEGTGGLPATDLSPAEHLVYAYSSLLIAAIVTTIASTMVHTRLHHVHIGPFLFWTATTGVLISTIEFLLFVEPSWPAQDDIIAFVAAIFLLDVAILTVNIAWRHIHPSLLILVVSSSVALFFALEYTVPSFVVLMPGEAPAILEIIGVVLVMIGCIAGPLWTLRVINHTETTTEG